jgi:hypothetical protein
LKRLICGCGCRSQNYEYGVFYLLSSSRPTMRWWYASNNSLHLTYAEHLNKPKRYVSRLLFTHLKTPVTGHQSCLRERYRQRAGLMQPSRASTAEVELMNQNEDSLMSNAGALFQYVPVRLAKAHLPEPMSNSQYPTPSQDLYILTTCRTFFLQMGQASTCFAHSTQEQT